MNTLNILCFGDSLTYGFPSNHNYATALKESLEGALSMTTVVPYVQGQNGDLVISPPGSFYPRIQDICELDWK